MPVAEAVRYYTERGSSIIPIIVAGRAGPERRREFTITGLGQGEPREAAVTAIPEGGQPIRFAVRVRLETPREWEYVRQGGILPYALARLSRIAPKP
jgi:aconitase A